MSPERNLCKDALCNAACCRNVPLGMSQEEFGRFTPSEAVAEEVSEENLAVIGEIAMLSTTRRVFYSKRDDRVAVQLVGPCPNLDATSYDCKIHNTRPTACRNMKRGGHECTEIRTSAGLGPVPIELHE